MTDQFVNVISFGEISTNVRDPFDVTLESLALAGTSIVSALRFSYPSVEGEAGVDISSVVTVSGQVLTIADIWANAETPTTGIKRIQVVAKNNDESAQEECNVLINVV